MKSAPALAHELHWGQKVLLVGGSEFSQSLPASILRAHGLQVKVGRKLAEGRSLWQPNMYDCVLLDVHSQLPEEAIDFCEQLRRAAPEQRIAFLSDPPHMCPSNGHTKSQLKTNTKEQRVAELKTAA